MFGAPNALFSGLAFAGVIYAIILQRNELRLQREDLQLSREELRLTREELAKTAAAQNQSALILEEQLEIERTRLAVLKAENLPLLEFGGATHPSATQMVLNVKNAGQLAQQLSVSSTSTAAVERLKHGDTWALTFNFKQRERTGTAKLLFAFDDVFGVTHQQERDLDLESAALSVPHIYISKH